MGSCPQLSPSKVNPRHCLTGQPITLDWIVEELLEQNKIIKSQKKEIDGLHSSPYAQDVKVESCHFDSLETILALLQAKEIIGCQSFA
jgi:predicted KAP-like P-loop ATPase